MTFEVHTTKPGPLSIQSYCDGTQTNGGCRSIWTRHKCYDSVLRPFDLGRREADSVSCHELVVRGDGLAVNPDQIILGLAVGNLLLKQLVDGRVDRHLDVVGETPSIIINEQNLHGRFSFSKDLIGKACFRGQATGRGVFR